MWVGRLQMAPHVSLQEKDMPVSTVTREAKTRLSQICDQPEQLRETPSQNKKFKRLGM